MCPLDTVIYLCYIGWMADRYGQCLRGVHILKGFAEFPAPKRRTTFALDEIVAAVKSERYRSGAKLPSERVLAEQMKVGRAAVREALSALEVMGIIERRVGDGTYVLGNVNQIIGVEEALAAVRENRSLDDVWKARKILEVVLAGLAVDKVTDSDLAAMRDSLQRIVESVAHKNYDDYVDADRDFHFSLAKAAKNPFLQQALFPILAITHQQVSTQVNSHYMAQHGKDMVEEHRAILDALVTKDKAGIAQAVKHHFLASERLFLDPKAEALEI